MIDPSTFSFDRAGMEGRTVLVAGGTGGLGSATSALLALDGAGVVAGYRADQERARKLQQAIEDRCGSRVQLVAGDITQSEVRSEWIATADGMGKGLYGLVCFTGDPGRVKFDDLQSQDLSASMEKNYFAPLLLAREAAAAMKKREISGAVVLIASMQAVALFESSINYAGSKAALVHAGRILAKQWGGPGGVRVNVVAPGVNRAGMALASIESGKYDHYLEKGVIPRFGRPEDVARVVRLLLEPDNYVTGQVITVDGGLTLRM